MEKSNLVKNTKLSYKPKPQVKDGDLPVQVAGRMSKSLQQVD